MYNVNALHEIHETGLHITNSVAIYYMLDFLGLALNSTNTNYSGNYTLIVWKSTKVSISFSKCFLSNVRGISDLMVSVLTRL